MSDSIKTNEEILLELRKLNKQFESKIKYDEQKEKTIERLHSELQKYKADLYKKMLLPIVNDLIRFIEREERNLHFLKENPPSIGKLIDRFFDLFDDMRDILYNQGIDAYKEEGDIFDPKRQKIIKKIITDDSNKDKKVANHRNWGYEWDGKIIKPEGVDLFIYKENYDEERTTVESINAKKKNNIVEIDEEMLINSNPIAKISDKQISQVIEESIEETDFDEVMITAISSPKAKKRENSFNDLEDTAILRKKDRVLEEETIILGKNKNSEKLVLEEETIVLRKNKESEKLILQEEPFSDKK